MDLNKFLNASLVHREETIEVPELKDFFGEEEPLWVVRGLTGAELGRANLAAESGIENARALVEAFSGDGDKAEAIRKLAGISESGVPPDISRRIELLTVGSIKPELGINHRDVAVKLAETFPTQFYHLTQTILSLTGRGAELGKPKPSGETPK